MITERQIEILRHTLCAGGKGEMFRNYFVAGEGHDDYKDLCELVDKGYMKRRPIARCIEDTVFYATEKGRDVIRKEMVDIIDCPFNCNNTESFSVETYHYSVRTDRGYEYEYQYAVLCEKCRALGPVKETKDEAIKAWNERKQ